MNIYSSQHRSLQPLNGGLELCSPFSGEWERDRYLGNGALCGISGGSSN